MKITRVAVGVIAYNEQQQFLLGKRKSACGNGMWSRPGGHLEFEESPEECAHRELMEKVGIKLINPTIIGVTSSTYDETKHYITIFVTGQAVGTPKNCEPEKCEGWDWFTWDTLPSPLLLSITNLLKKHPTKKLVPDNLQQWFSKMPKKTPETSV